MILPGESIGVIGDDAIGRMLAQAARSLGYRVQVFHPEGAVSPGTGTARGSAAAEDQKSALRAFAQQVDVVTCATEDIATEMFEAIAPVVPFHPRLEVLHLCQNRQREKAWLRANGFPHVRYAEALDGDIDFVIAQVGRPCVVKTADFSSDGRGHMKITDDAELERATAIFRGRRCVLERWLDFSCELGVIVARNAAGEIRAFPIAENIHARQILDVSIAPARISEAIAREAVQLASTLAAKLGVVGLLAVEFFVMPNGDLFVNELVPRPHNSGHWTLEGCETSQFEQHIRAICGLPLGAVTVKEPTVMVNILGDAWQWQDGHVIREPDWNAVLSQPRAKLHLYLDDDPRPGRRMGHFTLRDASLETAIVRAREVKQRLNRIDT